MNETVIRVTSVAQFLSHVPVFIGFAPVDSLVAVGLKGERDEVAMTLRYDLPGPDSIGIARAMVGHLADVFGNAEIEAGVAVLYGTEQASEPVITALMEQDAIELRDILRVEGDRYWSVICHDPASSTSKLKYEKVWHPVLAGREALAAKVAPVDAEWAEAMRQATKRAVRQIASQAGRLPEASLDAIQKAIAIYRDSTDAVLTDDEAAILTAALCDLRVRDDAWSRLVPEHNEAHQRLFTDLTRLASPGFVAAPASILAFVAWQGGNGALANVALDRALADDPDYSMALLLRQVITSGAPPSLARLPMTPEEVAACYAGQ